VKKKSSRYIGAETRANKEQDFLASLTVQTDDPDLVIDDEGNTLSFKTLVSLHGDSWADSGIQFFCGATEVFPFDVLNSFRVIAECRAKMKKLSRNNFGR
jgi:hypothetical protein